MPISNPAVGEVWQSSGQEGLIVALHEDNDTLTMVSRLGRQVMVANNESFRLLWSFKVTPTVTAQCSVSECLEIGHLRTIDSKSFCTLHTPRNQPLLFPGDSAEDALKANQAFTECPVCKKSEQPTWKMVGSLTVYQCSCQAKWILLTSRGAATDAFDLSEDIQEAHELLEAEVCAGVRGRVGQRAWETLQRSFRELRQASSENFRLAGVNLAVAVGLPNPASVLMIGYPRKAPAMTRASAPVDTLELNTYWKRRDSADVLRVYAIGGNLVWLTNRAGAIETRTPTGVKRGLELTSETWPIGEIGDRIPVTGETWWSIKDTEPTQVLSVGEVPGAYRFVELNRAGWGSSVRMVLADFLKHYQVPDATTEWEVGAEYELDDTVYVLKQVGDRSVLLTCNGREHIVGFLQFRRYRRLVRKTREQILAEDDL